MMEQVPLTALADLTRAFNDKNRREGSSLQQQLISALNRRDTFTLHEAELCMAERVQQSLTHERLNPLNIVSGLSNPNILNYLTQFDDDESDECSGLDYIGCKEGFYLSTDILLAMRESQPTRPTTNHAAPTKPAMSLPTTFSKAVQTDVPTSSNQYFQPVTAPVAVSAAAPAPAKKGFLIQSAKEMFIKEVSVSP